MITNEECQRKAEKYARRSLTVGEREDVLELLNRTYVQGFMQGYSCAGGLCSAAEAAEAAKGEP